MSILSFFEDNYELFSKFDGKLGSFNFPKDVYEIFGILMNKVNSHYDKLVNDIYDFRIKKDNLNNCYLEVVGKDNKTRIIIVKDNLESYKYYESIVGYKLLEDSFKKILDVYQKEKLRLANISKRFLKDNVSDIDLVSEFDLDNLKEYYEYLDKVFNSVKSISLSYEEPINIKGTHSNPVNKSKDRVNDVIDYDVRKQALMSYNPRLIVSLNSNNGNNKYEAYVYNINGYMMVICEPINGEKYTLFLNLGQKEYLNDDMIINNIKCIMESKEDILLSDDAVIRKGHTNMETYLVNLRTFFYGFKNNYRFYNDLEKSKEVYGISK